MKRGATGETTIDCPRDECEGVVQVTLEWEPPDPHYGMDADGNRGIYVAGYWTGTAVDACTLGHALTIDELADVEHDAVNDQSDPEDDYYGPDGPDEDY